MSASDIGWTFSGLLILLDISLRDLAHRRVPNDLAVIAAIYGLVRCSSFAGLSGAIGSIGCALLCASPLLVTYDRGLVGAADVKIGFACGAMVGLTNCVAFVSASLVSCACLSLIVLMVQENWRIGRVVARLLETDGALSRARRRRQTIPLTACLSVGVLWAWYGERSCG